MRRLTIIVAVLALLYGGYWFVGANRAEAGFRDSLASLADAGWQVSYDDLATRGFPSRFDTSIDNLSLTAPDGALTYRVPFVQVLALSYQPNRVIAALADTQVLRLGPQNINIQTEGLRASAAVVPGLDLSLDGLTVETASAEIISDLGWSLSLEKAIIGLRPKPPQVRAYDLYVAADDLLLPAQTSPIAITRLAIDSSMTLDTPLDRHLLAPDVAAPLVQEFSLNRLLIDLGEAQMTGTGTLDVNSMGIPSGRINLRATNWRAIIPTLVDAGLVDPGISPTLENMGETLSGGDETLDLPISFQNGFMSLGPLPLGPAPRFR